MGNKRKNDLQGNELGHALPSRGGTDVRRSGRRRNRLSEPCQEDRPTNVFRAVFVPFCLAVAPLLVLPGASDAFELPKRLAWGVLAVGLAMAAFPGSGRPVGRAALAGWFLLAWMGLRTLFAAPPFWRSALPFAAWAMPVLLLALAMGLRWGGNEKRRIARTVAILGVAEAFLMLCQRTGIDPVFGDEAAAAIQYAPGRMVGTVGYQNQAAEFVGLAILCAVAGWKSVRTRLGLVAPMLVALILTANRGAILALAAAAAVFLPRIFRSRRAVLSAAGAAVLLVCAALAVPEVRSRAAEIARPDRSLAVQSRRWMARTALSLWSDHPVFGAGSGSFAFEYVDRLGSVLPERKGHEHLRALVFAREAHCDPIQFAAEFGLVGLALLAALVALLAGSLRRRPPSERATAVAAAVLTTVASFFSFTWQTSLAGPLAGFLVGLWSAPVEEPENERAKPAVDGRPRWTGFAAIVPAAFLLFVVVAGTAQSLRLHGVSLHGENLAMVATGRLLGKDPAGALALFEKAETEDVSPTTLRNHGAALSALGRWEEALVIADRWARCGINHGEALRCRSACLERLGRIPEAEQAETERFRLFPRTVSNDSVYRLVSLRILAGRTAEAVQLAELQHKRSLIRDPASWTPRWDALLGAALLADGRKKAARPFLETAIRRDPSLQGARQNLRLLQNRKGGKKKGRP